MQHEDGHQSAVAAVAEAASPAGAARADRWAVLVLAAIGTGALAAALAD